MVMMPQGQRGQLNGRPPFRPPVFTLRAFDIDRASFFVSFRIVFSRCEKWGWRPAPWFAYAATLLARILGLLISV